MGRRYKPGDKFEITIADSLEAFMSPGEYYMIEGCDDTKFSSAFFDNQKPITQSSQNRFYEKGMEDAWDLAEKINEISITPTEAQECFKVDFNKKNTYEIWKEILKKPIHETRTQYENWIFQKQKKNIQPGDIVCSIASKSSKFLCLVSSGDFCTLMSANGDVLTKCSKSGYEKTDATIKDFLNK